MCDPCITQLWPIQMILKLGQIESYYWNVKGFSLDRKSWIKNIFTVVSYHFNIIFCYLSILRHSETVINRDLWIFYLLTFFFFLFKLLKWKNQYTMKNVDGDWWTNISIYNGSGSSGWQGWNHLSKQHSHTHLPLN